jgi:solute carrier family 25 folate transporter 32
MTSSSAGSKRVPTGVDHGIAGFLGGFLSTAGLYPLELIKTRMQVQDSGKGTYRSINSSIRVVLEKEGFRGLYQGLTPAILGACGSWGGYFYFYEMAKKRKLAQRTKNDKLQTVDHLLAGTEAGVILVIIFNPLWLTKTRLALQGVSTTRKPYKGFIDCLVTIAKEEGIRGLYKGIVPALLLTSHGAIQFATYEYLKTNAEILRNKNSNEVQPAWVSLVIGAAAKIFASTVTYPYQVVKSRLQQRDPIVISDIEIEKNNIITNNSDTSRSFRNSNTLEEIGARREVIQPRYTGTIDCVLKIWRFVKCVVCV